MAYLPFKLIFIVLGTLLAASIFLDITPHGASNIRVAVESAQVTNEAPEAVAVPVQEPANPEQKRDAKIGKITMLYGEPNPLYERALSGQEVHNERFGYPMFTLREKTLPGYWSKPAYILQLILTEMAKPESQRLHWLFWVDGDIVLMNPNIPLEIFLPPEPAYSSVHCVVTNDHRGLNNGAFFIRVHEWSVWLFSAIVSLTTYQPDLVLKFGDQTAMQTILEREYFANHTVYVPQRWFNAYAGYRGKGNHDPFSKPRKSTPNAVLEGDLQVHLAGGKKHRAEFMTPFLDASEMHTDRWEVPYVKTRYKREIQKFWKEEAPKQLKGRVELPKSGAELAGEETEDAVTEALKRFKSRSVELSD